MSTTDNFHNFLYCNHPVLYYYLKNGGGLGSSTFDVYINP